jgi:hypothetical protein
VIILPAGGINHSPWLRGKVRRHGWRSWWGPEGVGDGSEEDVDVDVVEGAEAEVKEMQEVL